MLDNKQLGVGCADFRGNEKKYLDQVFESGRLSYGPFSIKFENGLANVHDCKFGIFVNSGTGALRVAVAALKELNNWKDGDEILLPAVTFVASANVIIDHALNPILVDVDPVTYNIDVSKIEEKITPKTKGIIVVHLFGQPAEMDGILEIANKYNLKIIEDSCETMFAKYKGQSVGSFGDYGCFSSYMAHILVTGVGGMITTNKKENAIIARSLVNHGRDSIYLNIDDDKDLDDTNLKNVIAKRFRFERLGYSFRATEMESALGVAQLERLEDIVSARRDNANFFIENLKKYSQFIQLPLWPDYLDHSFMMFPILIKDEVIKKEDLTIFLENNNIETRDMMPLINQPVYKDIFGDIEDDYPVAKKINNNGFYIGCHQMLSKEDRLYIIDIFDKYFSNIKRSTSKFRA